MLVLDKPQSTDLDVLSTASELGFLAVAVRNERVCGLSFGDETAAQAESRVHRIASEEAVAAAARTAARTATSLDAVDLLERLVRYAAGAADDFFDVPVLLGAMTPFQRRVVASCRAIPCGSTRTYGQLAASAGSPGAARAVGQVMASNRIPLIVPCHRVVAASGGLGGFSAPQGVVMKKRLLAMEQLAAAKN